MMISEPIFHNLAAFGKNRMQSPNVDAMSEISIPDVETRNNALMSGLQAASINNA